MEHREEESEPVLYTPPTTLYTGPQGNVAFAPMGDGMMGRWLDQSALFAGTESLLFPEHTWTDQGGYFPPSFGDSTEFTQPFDYSPLEAKALKSYQSHPATAIIPTMAIAPFITPMQESLGTPLQTQTRRESPFPELIIGRPFVESPSPIASGSSSRRGRNIIDLPSEDDDDFANTMAVERNGMIWGMKVADYRSLSAKDRKRTRNRISARHFRLRRKRHYDSLAKDIGGKDEMLERAEQEAARLREEVARLQERIAIYEGGEVKPQIE